MYRITEQYIKQAVDSILGANSNGHRSIENRIETGKKRLEISKTECPTIKETLQITAKPV